VRSAHGDSNAYGDVVADAYGNGDGNSDRHGYAYRYRDCHADCNSNGDFYTYGKPDSNCHGNTYGCHTDPN